MYRSRKPFTKLPGLVRKGLWSRDRPESGQDVSKAHKLHAVFSLFLMDLSLPRRFSRTHRFLQGLLHLDRFKLPKHEIPFSFG